MNYEEWERGIPPSLRADAVWRRQDYRIASYIADTAWDDVTELARHVPTRRASEQLFEALGSIGSHISEGHSRGSASDRVRFLEYALGSARESRTWYARATPILGPDRVRDRLEQLGSVIRLLLTAIQSERGRRSGPRGMSVRRRGQARPSTEAPVDDTP